MNVLLKISLRNLLRQKRRNFLLGIALAFGTMILVLASSFSHGISDVLFNKIVVYVAGHLSVSFAQDGNINKQVFHDGDRMAAIVKNKLADVTEFQEAIGIFARAIGNGKADNVVLVGADLKQRMNIKKSAADIKKEQEEYRRNFKMVQGDFLDLGKAGFENPVAVSVDKAKYLNINKGDILRVRFRDVHGQSQAARLTVVAIYKPANTFMSIPVFLEVGDLKKIAGYGPHDIANLHLRIKDARKFAKIDADSLHNALQPGPAVAFGSISSGTKSVPASMLGFRNDTTALRLLSANLHLLKGDSASAFGKQGVLMAAPLASALGIACGDSCAMTYKTKYDPREVTQRYAVTALFEPAAGMDGNVLLVNEKSFFSTYYENWPQDAAGFPGAYVPKKTDKLYAALDPEWLLLDRCRTTEGVKKQYRDIGTGKFKGAVVDVESMYEMASDVLKLEVALNMITFFAVMLLFFIILIGVVNTLRMTIRERTREIGTVRAIGMQKKDVRNSFILETLFLGLFSAITGTILAFAAMGGLTLWKIDAHDNPISMLLVNDHLHFVPTAGSTAFFILLIVAISVVTAYFPARRAANMRASDALRHYE